MGRTHHSNCRSCEKTVDTVDALQPLHSDHLPSAIPLFAKAKQRQKQSKSKSKAKPISEIETFYILHSKFQNFIRDYGHSTAAAFASNTA